ncbi:MAG TPA: hypothetical protein VNX00_04560, partial [Herbaspirillum sp.]|nr:hypothetical protein [Herbaspirillum sp.]
MPHAWKGKYFTLWLVVGLILQGCHGHVPDNAGSAAGVSADAASIARGEYLANAADCISCHSVPGKGAYSGGYAMATPYGPIYGPNITPDKGTGIGHYTRDDPYRVLHAGRRPDGSPLYPAMPYTSYQLISR